MPNQVIDLWGEPIEVAISSKATHHASCTVIQTSPPGGGTLVHMHSREDEVLVVLPRQVLLLRGRGLAAMHPDEPFYAVRGRPHAYRNVGTEPGRMLVVACPGGLEEYFAAVSVLTLPADQARFEDISRMYGISVLPPGAVPEPG